MQHSNHRTAALIASKPARIITSAALAVALTATPMLSPVAAYAASQATQDQLSAAQQKIEAATSDYDREKLQERVAKLAGGVALIKVGAATEVEMKEKKARVEDALHATRAAVEEGIVPGGGVALIRAKLAIKDLKGANDEQNAGIKIVLRAMEEPLRQIVANAGDEPSVVVNNVANGEGNYGYNAQTGEYGDLVEMGVLDPTKVTRTALQNAASVASLILTTDCMVADFPVEEKAPAGMDAMGRTERLSWIPNTLPSASHSRRQPTMNKMSA